MVFSNDKTKHILVYKSKGNDRLLSEKQRTESQSLCLASARIYGPGQVTYSSSSCHASVGRVLTQAEWDLCSSPSTRTTQTYISQDRPSSLGYYAS